MSTTPADETVTGSSSPLFFELRMHLAAYLHATQAYASGADQAALVGDEANELRRRAALFALDNFRQLRDPAIDCITEDGLYALLRNGTVDASARPLISLLHRELSSIGHVSGVCKSTTHVAANGFAMPITFSRPRYVIDAFDLFELICATGRAQKK